MRMITLPVTALTLLLGAAGCHDDGLGTHNCPVSYDGPWRTTGLDLTHTDPTYCPVFIAGPGTVMRTSATLVDRGSRDFVESRLLVTNARNEPQAAIKGVFGWDEHGQWAAQPTVRYPAGTAGLAPDNALLDVYFLNLSPGPFAHMRISYTDRLIASISGLSSIQPNANYTWHANVTHGEPPFTYRWYRDWELVSTDASYSGPAGWGEWPLRLDVYDARGEATSRTRVIRVSECGAARVC
jgi:hypothetical protein